VIDFNRLRFDKTHHLGLGDIRLTVAEQEEIEKELKRALKKAYLRGYNEGWEAGCDEFEILAGMITEANLKDKK